MRSKRIWLAIAIMASACGCEGQSGKGSPSDPNEQQGNAKAQPEKSISPKPGKQPGDDQAGKDAHTKTPDGAKRQ